MIDFIDCVVANFKTRLIIVIIAIIIIVAGPILMGTTCSLPSFCRPVLRYERGTNS